MVDGTLSNQLTVRQIARWNEQYLITAGKLWSRSALESGNHEWEIVTNTFNGSTESATLFPIVRWQPADSTPMLLAGVFFLDDMSFALIQADDNDIGLKDISWTQVSDSVVEGREVIALFTPNADESVLFAVIANSRDESRTYTLLSADTRSGSKPVFKTELTELPQPVVAIASDTTNTYWAVSGSSLYRGTLGDFQESNSAPIVSTGSTYGGILHVNPSSLLLSGRNGTLWLSTDSGETWADSHEEPTTNNQTVAFTRFVAIGNTILVGTESFGYYTVIIDSEELSATRLSFTTEALYTASIHQFWIDPESPVEEETVFALTNGAGMLRAVVGKNENLELWQQE